MGTEILRPHNLLAERVRVPPVPFHRRRDFSGNENGNLTDLVVNRKGNYAGHRKVSPKADPKKIKTVTETKKPSTAEPRRKYGVTNGGLVMGQVTLLRRGESFDSLASKSKSGDPESTSANQKPVVDVAVSEPRRIEPDSPLAVPKQINVRVATDGYAGSAFISSPSPRSVPLPSFFKKQQVHAKIKSFDDSATRDLRRLLRLD